MAPGAELETLETLCRPQPGARTPPARPPGVSLACRPALGTSAVFMRAWLSRPRSPGPGAGTDTLAVPPGAVLETEASARSLLGLTGEGSKGLLPLSSCTRAMRRAGFCHVEAAQIAGQTGWSWWGQGPRGGSQPGRGAGLGPPGPEGQAPQTDPAGGLAFPPVYLASRRRAGDPRTPGA